MLDVIASREVDMKVQCPYCRSVLDVSGLAPDSVARCGGCSRTFKVPGPAPEIAPAIEPGTAPVFPGTTGGGFSPPAVPRGPSAVLPTPPKAIVSLVLGICSFFMCGIVMAIPGLVLGYQSRREIDAAPGQWGGRGVASAGIVVNWISIVFFVGLIVLVLAAVLFGGMASV